VTPLDIDPETLRLAAQCLNHYAIRGPGIERVTAEVSKAFNASIFRPKHLKIKN
jgi:hypothetical protein